jgi:hypothetical protein
MTQNGSWNGTAGAWISAHDMFAFHHFPTGHHPCTMKRGKSKTSTDCETPRMELDSLISSAAKQDFDPLSDAAVPTLPVGAISENGRATSSRLKRTPVLAIALSGP